MYYDVIATRRSGIGLMYGFCTLFSIVLISMGIASELFFVWIFGGILVAVSGYLTVSFIITPSVVIWLDADGKLCLPRGVVLDVGDLIDVSYKRATARGISYKWGSVTLTTHTCSYKYGFIAECEDVAKRLTDMMYKAKYAKRDSDK